jgi:hypothetical protein
MPRTLHAAVIVEMPDDEWEAAALMTTLRPHWTTFVEALQASGAKFSQELNTASTRNVVRRRRGPKPRPPRLVEQAEEAPAAELMPVA